MARFVTLLVATGAWLGLTVSANAQEILLTGPLAVPPPRPDDQRAERFELGAAPGLVLGSNDRPSFLFGALARYYIWDVAGLGAFGGFGVPFGEGRTALSGLVMPELVLVPITGRSRTFCDGFFRSHISLLAAPAFAFTRRDGAVENTSVPTFGAAFTGFIDRRLSLALEYRIAVGAPARHLVTVSTSWWSPRRLAE